MSKAKSNATEQALNKRVTAVWLIQNNKRFLLNYFHDFEIARSYVRSFSHLTINGQVLIGECTVRDLIND